MEFGVWSLGQGPLEHLGGGGGWEGSFIILPSFEVQVGLKRV